MRYYMSKRMTWAEIEKAYPSQWLGLTDVEWADEDHANIASYTGKPADELLLMMHKSKKKIIARSTPHHTMYVGMLG